MPDGFRPYPGTRRHVGVAAILQWHATVDPDTAKYVATLIIEWLDRDSKRAAKDKVA